MPRKKKVAKPIKILSLDTETIGLAGDIKRIAIYDGEHLTYGYSFNDVEHVLVNYSIDYEVHVYIHNLEFDLRKMPKVFELGNVLWSQCSIINGRYVKVTCRNYTFHDSFRILPESLASLSKSFDLEHGKLDLWEEVQRIYPGVYSDHVDFLSRCDKDDELYLKYLGYDTIALYELIEKLMDVAGLDEDVFVRISTTASLSRYIFKNGYKGQIFKHDGCSKTDFEMLTSCKAWSSDKPIKANYTAVDISYKEIEKLLRTSYCGGRTEVFTPVADGAYHYDVNSEYPTVMGLLKMLSGVAAGLHYPIGYPEYYKGDYQCKFQFSLWQRKKKGLGFLECVVDIPKQDIPPLPVKRQKLMFPTGIVKGMWTYTELEYAIKNCGVKIVEFIQIVFFPKTFPVFENFVKVFSNMKAEAKEKGLKALEKLSKLLLNTGYGYCGMNRNDKSELQDISKIEKYEENGRLIYSNEEYGFIEIESIVIADYIQVQVASYVTSYARLILLDALRAQAAVGTVYYCDTDSIVCSHPMAPEMIHKSELGKWDCEAVLISGIFIQPKVYYEHKVKGETIKFKGVSRETAKSFDDRFYKKILASLKEGDRGKLTVEREKELLRSIKYTQKQGIDMNTLEKRDKQLNLENKQKRQMFYNENYSVAWHFNSLSEFEEFSFDVDYTPFLNKQGVLLDAY